MVPSPSVQDALARLQSALDALDAAHERVTRSTRSVARLEEDMQRLGLDRAKLAEVLDGEKSRSIRLEDANREVSRRLVAAMESIRSVLDAHGG